MTDVHWTYCDHHFVVYVSQIIMLYTWNSYSAVGQLYKLEEKMVNFMLCVFYQIKKRIYFLKFSFLTKECVIIEAPPLTTETNYDHVIRAISRISSLRPTFCRVGNILSYPKQYKIFWETNYIACISGNPLPSG